MNIAAGLQLAKTVKIEDVKYPCRAEVKVDGVRLIAINNKYYTRTGKQVNLTTKIDTSLYMLDLEVTLESGKMEDRGAISGMINSAMKGGTIDESLLVFHVLDIMLIAEYERRSSLDTLGGRLFRMKNYLHDRNHQQFKMVEYRDVHNKFELDNYFSYIIGSGMEGLVIKYYKDKYQFKRSKQWGKMKMVRTADLLCVGIAEGKGKYKGMIGALDLEGTVQGKDVIVSVGSGMTDEDRQLAHTYYLGNIIEIKYSHITVNYLTGIYSLNQPRFVMIRMDK